MMVTPTHQPHARVALLVTIQGGDLRAATSVQPVSTTLTLIRRLRARTAQQASTPQRGQYHAVTVWQGMQTRTVIHRRLVQCAVWVSIRLHGVAPALIALQAGMIVISTRPLRALAALLDTTLQRGLQAATSVQQVSMTPTLILPLHAQTAQ